MKNKILSLKELKNLRKKFKSKKIGLVHGVFDLFHYGHLLHIEKAKSLCDILVVSITSKKFIKKGPGRPFYNDFQRKNVLSSLKQVDYVIISEKESSVDIIKSLKPNIYFKGNDYSDFSKDYSKKIYREVETVKKYKGKVFFTNEETFSSTKLINNFSDYFDSDVRNYLFKISKEINFKKIVNLFKKINKLKILVIGEIIIDKYTFTYPLGKSPKEQLIPVTTDNTETYGGGVIATSNHISNFVNECTTLSVLGDNKIENNKAHKLINKKVKKNFFINPKTNIITKTRFIDKNSSVKLFQISNMSKLTLSKSTEYKIFNYLKKNIKKFDQIIVNDFGHGLISKKIIKFLQRYSKNLSVNVQTNSSNIGYNYLTKYSKVNYFTIDEPEARLALQDTDNDCKKLFMKFKKRISFKYGSITFGEHGTNIFDGKKMHFIPALARNPVDTLGAGDAYFAMSSLFTSVTKDPKIISFIGSIAGALKIKSMGHRKSLEKLEFLNFTKNALNI